MRKCGAGPRTGFFWNKKCSTLAMSFGAILFFISSALARDWTEAEARKQVFDGIKTKIDVSKYPKHDPDYESNLQALRSGARRAENRFITPNNIGYMVSTIGDGNVLLSTLLYDKEGSLEAVRIFSNEQYPRAAYMYCAKEVCDNGGEKVGSGEIVSRSFQVSPSEWFYFASDGRLTLHEKIDR